MSPKFRPLKQDYLLVDAQHYVDWYKETHNALNLIQLPDTVHDGLCEAMFLMVGRVVQGHPSRPDVPVGSTILFSAFGAGPADPEYMEMYDPGLYYVHKDDEVPIMHPETGRHVLVPCIYGILESEQDEILDLLQEPAAA